ncbi:MAG: hypothetical protein HQ553_11165 [Chloroflexi bacterium]|nr:hypothetical protein [Chloroflexota bacterium]
MMTTISETDIDIDRQIVCRYIGYSRDVEPSPRIASLLDEYIENAKHLIEPSYSYVIKNVHEVNDNCATVEDSVCFEGKVISKLLDRCDKVAIFVLTIGGRLEEIAAQLADDNMIVESYVLDAIGSSAVENLAEFVQGIIGETAYHRGFSISRRFSPGYCDWDISQQEKVFQALDGHSSVVKLSPEHLMTPQKSISGIIGMAPSQNDVATYNPCKTCEKHNCVGRR